jgi:Holliday junction resolvasome RuvABC endonuclease subunit
MKTVVVGVDPSSRKLAAVISIVGDEGDVVTNTRALPQDKGYACHLAYEWMKLIVEENLGHGKVHVFIELPVFGRGGPGSTIPQARVNGAITAGAIAGGAEVIDVNNSHVKKVTVGKGNATKDDIRDWVEVVWPELFEQISKDQDLCDASMIYIYGRGIVTKRDRIAKRRAAGGITVKRKKST